MSTAFDKFDDAKKAQVFRLRDIISEKGNSAAWDAAWQEGVTPWDNGVPQIALVDLFENGFFADKPKSGRVLVPGCGKGYDATHLGSLGYDAWGADLSPNAIKEAQDWYKTHQPKDFLGSVTFKTLDFFEFDIPGEKFTLVYDYTFLCALPPTLREAWGQRMTQLVKPGGHLVCLVYPIDGDRQGGPPYSVDVPAYEKVLGESWKKIVDKEPISGPGSRGNQRIVVWERAQESGAAKI